METNPENEPFLVRAVAKAIARATCDKLNVLKRDKVDRDQFAVDWWHYYMSEAREAVKTQYAWHAKNGKLVTANGKRTREKV